jgi:hypothetical protein
MKKQYQINLISLINLKNVQFTNIQLDTWELGIGISLDQLEIRIIRNLSKNYGQK